MAINHHLKQDLIAYTHQFIDNIKNQQSNPNNLSWCLHNPIGFRTGYSTVNQMGSTSIKQFMNVTIGSSLSTISKQFRTTVLSTIQERYLTPLTALGVQFDHQNKIYFLSSLNALLKKYWFIIHKWPLPDLFSYLNQCCQLYFKSAELPEDLYLQEKSIQNQYGIKAYEELRLEFIKNKRPLSLLCYLCVRANWIDSYEPNRLTIIHSLLEEINDILDDPSSKSTLIQSLPLFHYQPLTYEIQGNPKVFLYECDNHGELFFDLILIEYMLIRGHQIIISTKHAPILNDVTFKDMTLLIKSPTLSHLKPYFQSNQLSIIDNGSKDVFKSLHTVSNNYKQAYTQADVIILKGQGHFESFPILADYYLKKRYNRYKKPHYYLLGLKSSISLNSLKLIYPKAELQMNVLYYYES